MTSPGVSGIASGPKMGEDRLTSKPKLCIQRAELAQLAEIVGRSMHISLTQSPRSNQFPPESSKCPNFNQLPLSEFRPQIVIKSEGKHAKKVSNKLRKSWPANLFALTNDVARWLNRLPYSCFGMSYSFTLRIAPWTPNSCSGSPELLDIRL